MRKIHATNKNPFLQTSNLLKNSLFFGKKFIKFDKIFLKLFCQNLPKFDAFKQNKVDKILCFINFVYFAFLAKISKIKFDENLGAKGFLNFVKNCVNFYQICIKFDKIFCQNLPKFDAFKQNKFDKILCFINFIYFAFLAKISKIKFDENLEAKGFLNFVKNCVNFYQICIKFDKIFCQNLPKFDAFKQNKVDLFLKVYSHAV
ncbi:MAG: hypothetical protein K5978_02790 [Campylobacter sp.]|nr:hypothetical protein [Campylobacter sp.]